MDSLAQKNIWKVTLVMVDRHVEGETFLTREQIKEIAGSCRIPAGIDVVVADTQLVREVR